MGGAKYSQIGLGIAILIVQGGRFCNVHVFNVSGGTLSNSAEGKGYFNIQDCHLYNNIRGGAILHCVEGKAT